MSSMEVVAVSGVVLVGNAVVIDGVVVICGVEVVVASVLLANQCSWLTQFLRLSLQLWLPL